ncbi:MAG: universal stress protein [Thermodesulfobacteriota bacterium]
MIKKILVPIDGSDDASKAIEIACDIALKYAARIYLLHVVSLPAIFLDGAFPAMEGMLRLLEEDGKKIIEEAERETKKCGLKDVQSAIVQGDPANRIIEFAKTEGVDMIAIGSRGLTGMKGILLGSVSHKIFHLADHIYIMVVK